MIGGSLQKPPYARVAEQVDALVLETSVPAACGFDSHLVHHTRYVSTNNFKSYVFKILILECLKEPVIEDADTVNSMVQVYTE